MTGVGLFAALALMVRQRTTELAVRIALGRAAGDPLRVLGLGRGSVGRIPANEDPPVDGSIDSDRHTPILALRAVALS